jgi:hypothetical protein
MSCEIWDQVMRDRERRANKGGGVVEEAEMTNQPFTGSALLKG